MQSDRRRNEIDLTSHDEVVSEGVANDDLGLCRARGFPRSLDRPVSTVRKHILDCNTYKAYHGQKLLSADLPERENFASEFLAHMQVDNEWLWKVMLKDEHIFIWEDMSIHRIAIRGQKKSHLQIDQNNFILQINCKMRGEVLYIYNFLQNQ